MRVKNIGAHITHCCIIHGCKYGDKDCPVVNAEYQQEFLCELCHDNWLKCDMKQIKNKFIKENRKLKLKKIKNELYSS